jgi:hypothetical protein
MRAALPVTAIYAALLATLVILLLLVVVRLRRGFKVGIGDGGNRELARAIRVHANAVENIPLFLILLALYELNGGGALVAHGIGATFLLSRVAHAGGLLRSAGPSPARVLGTAGNVACLITLAILNLKQALGA